MSKRKNQLTKKEMKALEDIYMKYFYGHDYFINDYGVPEVCKDGVDYSDRHVIKWDNSYVILED